MYFVVKSNPEQQILDDGHLLTMFVFHQSTLVPCRVFSHQFIGKNSVPLLSLDESCYASGAQTISEV